MTTKTLDRGRYEVIGILGQRVHRQYSTVYEAYDSRSGARVAIKTLALDGTHAEIARAMFRKEVDALDGFEHPAIVRLLGSFEENDRLGIVLELVPGGKTLESLIEDVQAGRSEKPSVRWTLAQLRRLLSALEAAHHRNIIHRDIKPSNILFDTVANELKLADFGVAQVLEHYTHGAQGVTLKEFYSRPYAAPEQVLGKRSTFASDMYAFGVLSAAALGWVLPTAEYDGAQLFAVLAPLLDELPSTEARGRLFEMLRSLGLDEPALRPRAAEVERGLREATELVEEPSTVPVAITKSALDKARLCSIGTEAALLADLSEGLRAQYRAENDRNGRASFVIDCYGKTAWALFRPTDDDGLVMVDAGRKPPAMHQRHRENGISIPITLRQGEGNADEFVQPCYSAYLQRQEEEQRSGDREGLLKVARFVLQRQRQRCVQARIGYRVSDDEVADGRGRVKLVPGAYARLRVLNVKHADDDDQVSELDLSTELCQRSSYVVDGRQIGDFQNYDRAKRVLVLRVRRKTRLRREGTLEIRDIATETALKRQESALDRFLADECINPRLGQLLVDPSSNRLRDITECTLLQDLRPVEEMRSVVERALAAEDFFLVQGPPGTGKTTLIAEIVGQILLKDPRARVLLTSQANAAVDNALDRLAALAKEHGCPWRLTRDVPEHGRGESSVSMERTFRAWVERTRSRSVAALERYAAGTPENLASVRAALARWSTELDRAEDVRLDYAQSVNVFGVTCLRVPTLRKVLRDVRFDWVVVDEAAKATPSEVLVSLAVARRFIMVGDQRQLPPYLDRETEDDVKKAGLDVQLARTSLFEDAYGRLPQTNRHILRRQHRMHRSIADLVGGLYYADVGGLNTALGERMPDLCIPELDRESRVFWLDVAGQERPQGTSWWNDKELQAVCKIVQYLDREVRNAGAHYTVGLIAPYAAQVARLAAALRSLRTPKGLELQVDTVDAFQGREVDVILYSLVRTSGGDNPFLGDPRRLNVAFSRAKRLLMVVGHRAQAQSRTAMRAIVERIPITNVLQVGNLR